MLPQAPPHPRGWGKETKGKSKRPRSQTPGGPDGGRDPSQPPAEEGGAGAGKGKTSLLATEVGVRLESAITSKRALAPKERTATTYMNGSEASPLPLKEVARRVETNAPSSPKAPVNSVMLVGTSTEATPTAAPLTTTEARARTREI